MKTTIDLPWPRYGLIAELALRLQDKSPQFGKTALQKIVYLLQELYGIKCGYEFTLYTYGPFSQELLSDLDFVEALDGVSVRYVVSGVGGYVISPGAKNDLVRDKAKDFLSMAGPAIEKVVNEFGGFGAKDLELRSTIVYADRDIRRAGKELSRKEFVRLIKDIKPYFSTEMIENVLSELEVKGYVKARE